MACAGSSNAFVPGSLLVVVNLFRLYRAVVEDFPLVSELLAWLKHVPTDVEFDLISVSLMLLF